MGNATERCNPNGLPEGQNNEQCITNNEQRKKNNYKKKILERHEKERNLC
ncbi:hypothetical protein AGMMS49525_04140 [Bacteroidia bacterium]|nr:hypothetical protein AGMMS49525_04140 [Bacteroidia bacterium]